MVICELCGSANVETDAQCRVCGQALAHAVVAPAPVAVQAAVPVAHDLQAGSVAPAPPVAQPSVDAIAGWPTPPPMPVQNSLPPEQAQRSLQMSAYSAPVESVAPPMLGGTANTEETLVENLPGSDLPSFMQSGSRGTGPAPEPVQLVSANDLPEWLRQIAEADAAKAEAEAQAQVGHSDAPATIVKKPLPGETMVSNRTTNWLSKSGGEAESPDHWDSSEIANANWGNLEPAPQAAPQQEYPSIIPPTAFVPTSTEAYSNMKSKGRFSIGNKSSASSSDRPFHRNQTFQLALLVVLVALFALILLT